MICAESMREEVLRNEYEPQDVDEDTVIKQIEHEVDQQYLSRQNEQNLSKEEILSLKLFTDLDNLQKEFNRAFWDVEERKENEDERQQMITRRRQFYHWATVLRRAFKYANVPIRRTVYRGYDKLLQLRSFNPFCGQPTSTSTDLGVAQQFAGQNGIVVVSNSSQEVYGLDVSWFSRFQNEKEVWIYQQHFPIQKVMVMLRDEGIKTRYIQEHLANIGHQLHDMDQFLHHDDKRDNNYIHHLTDDKEKLREQTNFGELSMFERLFFEWYVTFDSWKCLQTVLYFTISRSGLSFKRFKYKFREHVTSL